MGVEKHTPIVEPRTVASYVSSTPEERLSEPVSQSHLISIVLLVLVMH